MIDCTACGRWHDAAGAPWCAGAGAAPDPGASGGAVPLRQPGPAVPGPDPRDVDLFAGGRPSYPDEAPYAGAAPDGDRADDTVAYTIGPGRARHGRGRRRRPPRARLAALAAAGVAALSGGLVAANMLGGDGPPDTGRADERPDAPLGPLPTDGPGTPGSSPATAGPAERDRAPDRAQRSRPATAPPAARTADPTTPGPGPSRSSATPGSPSSTASSRATVSTPSGTPSGSQSSSPTHSPTPTPTGSAGEEGERERTPPESAGR